MFKGMIIFWHGTAEFIPHGWHLCDGSNGAPDLLRYIPIGAGGAYNIGDNAHTFVHSHIAHESHYHYVVTNANVLSGEGRVWLSSYAYPLITSDYVDHHPPFFALLPIMKL